MRPPSHRWIQTALLVALGACDAPSTAPFDGGGLPDLSPPSDGSGPVGAVPPSAAARYATLCASCHGEVGEGGRGPSLQDWKRGRPELVNIIGTRMPANNPLACRGDCPTVLADYILQNFTSAALACPTTVSSPRRLRLLTRREYRNTVRDLLGFTAPAMPASASCNHQTFRYDPAGMTLRTVALAGTFNDWSADRWPMTYSATTHLWTLERDLPDGSYQYKFVLDGSRWVRDPANPMTVSDGFGGQNSVLQVACATPGPGTATASSFDPAATLPVENRPTGFLFDDNADTGLVTPAHVNEYLRAAQSAVTALGTRITSLVSCDAAADARGCAERFAREFGQRAFRRPLTPAEVTRYQSLITSRTGYADGLALALRAFLVSPNFLYRSEMGTRQPDGSYKLTGYEVATALAYTLWETAPDAALYAAAASGALDTPAGIEREARRLMADPRARTTMGNFSLQWLGVEPIAQSPRSTTLYPEWNDALRTAMLDETRRFVTHVIFDGTHRLSELFTADYSFVNEPLARVYGISGVTGAELVRQTYPDATRSGILGHGSIAARYAHSDQSSPILRGVFVRTNLLCQSFAPPPPNAGGVPDVDPRATTRERFRQHTSNPVCATCHRDIDPLGFGFESFDAIGRYRTTENGMPIDHAGAVTDLEGFGTGTSQPFTNLRELGQILAGSTSARACFVRQYFRYARGYRETAADRCALTTLTSAVHAAGDDLREVPIRVVLSPEFVRRREVSP